MRTQKLKLVLESWHSEIKLTVPVLNVHAVKVRWLQFTSATANNTDLQLGSRDLGSSGFYNRIDGSTDDYFFAMPLDPQIDVVNVFTNFTSEYDITYNKKIRSIDRFTLEALINDSPGTDITDTNPLIIEFMFLTD